MYYTYRYPYPNYYYNHIPTCHCGHMLHSSYSNMVNNPNDMNGDWRFQDIHNDESNRLRLKDHGKEPFVININEAARQNTAFRTAIWTGDHLQVTVMSIKPGDDVGLEVHHDIDQFLRIEEGQGLVQMGKSKNHLSFRRQVHDDSAIMVPAGTWHNITNTGHKPLKLYSIYAPPEHPFGTVHQTKKDADAAEHHHHHHRSSE